MERLVESVDQVSGRLVGWLARSANGARTRFVYNLESEAESRPETGGEGDRRVDACFRALSRLSLGGAGTAGPEIFRVSYRLRARGRDPLDSQRLHGEIFFAASEPDAEFTLDPTSEGSGFDARGPFLNLIGLLERRRPSRAPVVLQPPRLKVEAVAPLSGRVLDDGGRPVARAEVEAPELGRRASTDADGRFVMPSAPSGGVVRLRVVARSVVQDVSIKAGSQDETIIKLAMERDDA